MLFAITPVINIISDIVTLAQRLFDIGNEIMLKQIHIYYLKLSVLCQPACGRQAVIYIMSSSSR